MWEKIIGYFGTYTAAADGAIATFKFEYLTTLGLAALVIFGGRFIVKHSAPLRKYAIPAPVVSGVIFSIIVSILKGGGIIGLSFDTTIMKDFCQNVFFLGVGYGFSLKTMKKFGAGKIMVMIALGACILITLQDVVGILVGQLVGMHPLLALQCSSASMSGGVGTASALGSIYEEWGAADATTIGVAAGTLGNLLGSLIGGPCAAFLIHKHNLKCNPNDKPETELATVKPVIDNTRFIYAFAWTLFAAALGMPIYCLLDNIPFIEMPKFIGCLFAGAIIRNILEANEKETYSAEMESLEHMFLELYLALVLMTIDITKLAPVAGKMAVIIVAQGVLIATLGIFLFFRMFGSNYDAAVMVAGNIGWGCGSAPNSVANTKAIMDEYGYSSLAWILYPSFAVIIDDIYNPIFLSVVGGLFK